MWYVTCLPRKLENDKLDNYFILGDSEISLKKKPVIGDDEEKS
jgi:hypothetical protein